VAFYGRGVAYADIGEREEAIADLETALDLGLSPEAEQQAEELLEELGK
jgi:tetratricopeptide (TPR) repeat protein